MVDGCKLPPFFAFKRKTPPENYPPENIKSKGKGWMGSATIIAWLHVLLENCPSMHLNIPAMLMLETHQDYLTSKRALAAGTKLAMRKGYPQGEGPGEGPRWGKALLLLLMPGLCRRPVRLIPAAGPLLPATA